MGVFPRSLKARANAGGGAARNGAQAKTASIFQLLMDGSRTRRP
jgi:hypothetical protein